MKSHDRTVNHNSLGREHSLRWRLFTACSNPDELFPRSCSDDVLVMSGGASLDEIDGHSVTVIDGDDISTLQLTSPVRGMHVLEDIQADRDSGIVNSGPDAENATTTTGMNDTQLRMILVKQVL